MTNKKSNQLLARVNFPLYTVHRLTERHILVAGGGGGAKTGIRNVIEIYELINNGYGCRAESVAHYETGSQAIMNCTIYNSGNFFILFAGMEGMCQLYKLKHKIEEKEHETCSSTKEISEEISNHSSLRARKSKDNKCSDTAQNQKASVDSEEKCPDKNVNSVPIKIGFEIKPLESFQTDFSDDPFQKLVRFSCTTKILATAGSDGHIRVWKYPELKKMYEVHAHKDDVDDLDISPLGDKIVSVSRDGHGKVWNSDDGILISNLEYDLPVKTTGKYIYRSCRFAIVENDKTNPVLFVSLNPAVRKKPPSPCFLSKWNTKQFTMEKIVSTGTEMLSAMAVSDDGRFVGLGTQEGSVKIYIAFSLQLLYRADHVHGIFVTGLEFLQTNEESRRITGGQDTSLISISVDNHINVHYIPQPASIGIFTIVFMFIIVLFFIFVIMDYFNL